MVDFVLIRSFRSFIYVSRSLQTPTLPSFLSERRTTSGPPYSVQDFQRMSSTLRRTFVHPISVSHRRRWSGSGGVQTSPNSFVGIKGWREIDPCSSEFPKEKSVLVTSCIWFRISLPNDKSPTSTSLLRTGRLSTSFNVDLSTV